MQQPKALVWWVVLACAGLGGCGSPVGATDGGATDGGEDAGKVFSDAGTLDAGALDAGSGDAGSGDAGPGDAGAPDGGQDPGAGDGGYRRPYGPRAAWNIPAAGLPAHPDSTGLANVLWENGPATPGDFNANNDMYTYPVYDAREATGEYTVDTTWATNLDGKTMPFNPAWIPSAGTDAQIIVLDPRDGREWNLWQVRVDGGVVYATNGNLVPGSYWTREDGFKPSRGIGVQYFAMLVTPEEVAAGAVLHALSMPISNTAGDYCVAPGTKVEHPTNGPSFPTGTNIPEGTRFALSVTDAELEAWVLTLPPQARSSARIVGRAMRDYGWFITDTSGSAKIQLEDVTTSGEAWTRLGLMAQQTDGGYGPYRYNNKTYPRDLLDGLMTKARIYAIQSSQTYAYQAYASACR